MTELNSNISFEMKFNKTIEEFYDEFDSFVANSDISLEVCEDLRATESRRRLSVYPGQAGQGIKKTL